MNREYNVPMEEQSLIDGCKRGDALACKKLYEQYAPIMMTVCMRYVNNRETAKDILQEGFIKVFTKMDMYSGSGSLAGWMRRVFATTALEYLRQNDALKLSVNIDDFHEATGNTDISVLDRLSAEELMTCVAELPQGFRTVFNLFAIEGYTHAEIAEMLNIKESTSRSQFIRARQALQKNVESLIVHKNAR